ILDVNDVSTAVKNERLDIASAIGTAPHKRNAQFILSRFQRIMGVLGRILNLMRGIFGAMADQTGLGNEKVFVRFPQQWERFIRAIYRDRMFQQPNPAQIATIRIDFCLDYVGSDYE